MNIRQIIQCTLPAAALLAASWPVALSGQPPGLNVLAEKVRLAPRAIPGMDHDPQQEVPVVPFSSTTAPPPVEPPAGQRSVFVAGEKARIVQIHRRGTMPIPPPPSSTSEASTASIPSSPQPETPPPLPEGKVRIIPRATVAQPQPSISRP